MAIRRLVLSGVAAALVLSGPLLGYEVATHAASGSPKPRHVYRLEYALRISEPGKAAVTDTYVLSVEEGAHGDVTAGANIPLVAGPSPSQVASPRQDVGVAIHCTMTRVGNDLLLHNNFDVSTAEVRDDPGPRAIRKMTSNDDVLVTPGMPALVVNLEEAVSHARYEITVTATKLR